MDKVWVVFLQKNKTEKRWKNGLDLDLIDLELDFILIIYISYIFRDMLNINITINSIVFSNM